MRDYNSVDTGELNGEELNKVSGGFFTRFLNQGGTNQDAPAAAQDKKAGDQIKAFQEMLQEI
jgi:hypothetical protein